MGREFKMFAIVSDEEEKLLIDGMNYRGHIYEDVWNYTVPQGFKRVKVRVIIDE